MEDGGVYAIVRGLEDSGLAVTLLDSGRQFTLHPENFTHPSQKTVCHTTASQCATRSPQRASSVQATDGRYTSTYKMMHCHYTPTSPPEQVTEFPPQRPDPCPGHGNFVVGGAGSGERYCQPAKSSDFRGGMCWPDRGAVFSPRPSLRPDSFATSLRNYPRVSPDRSSEVVERLINFTQATNSYRNNRNASQKILQSDDSKQTFCLDKNNSRHTSSGKSRKTVDSEASITPKRLDEPPTRDNPACVTLEPEPLESWRRPTFCTTSDVRYLRELSRRVREGIRSLSAQPDNRPERNPREMVDSPKPRTQNTNKVNMEVQAAVQVTSREVTTLPRIVPSQRNIAVPITPKSSEENLKYVNPNENDDFHVVSHDSQIKIDKLRSRKTFKCKSKRYKRPNKRMQDILSNPRFYSNPLYPLYNSTKSKNIIMQLTKTFDNKLYKDICSKSMLVKTNFTNVKHCSSHPEVFRAELTFYKELKDENLNEIIEQWIKLIPFNENDDFTLHKYKELIFLEITEYLKLVTNSITDQKCQDKLKYNIIERLKRIPFKTKGNRNIILNRLVDILISNITRTHRKKWNLNINNKSENKTNVQKHLISKGFIPPSEEALRNLIHKDLIRFLKASSLNFHQFIIEGIEDKLVNLIIRSVNDLYNGQVYCIENDIAVILNDCGLPIQQGYYFAKMLMDHLKTDFVYKTTHVVQSETLILLPPEVTSCNKSVENSSSLIKNTKKRNNADNETVYTDEICHEIQEWLTQLRLNLQNIPKQSLEKAVTDLAEDIIDRRKYLEINNNKVSEDTELEYFKYLIFKFLSKTIGEENLEAVQHATDLMNRINTISTPKLLLHQEHRTDNTHISISSNITNNKLNPELTNQYSTDKHKATIVFNQKTVPCSNAACASRIVIQNSKMSAATEESLDKKVNINSTKNNIITTKSGNDKIEAEYDEFVKDWIKKIPIVTLSPHEEISRDKARIGLYNGLWKTVTKLNCDPATYFNRFLYEDMLEDSIDDLLNCLPQSSELQCIRHRLKVEFIQKTTHMNELLKQNDDASFRNKLIQNVAFNIHQQEKADDLDPTKLHEDLQIMKLVDDYLLSTRFKNEDKIKSAVYKTKLLKEAESFVNNLKNNHSSDIGDINVSSYKDNLLKVLQDVPIPDENTINQEADNVLLEIEIEQWYHDLPITPTDDYVEQYKRMRQRHILARKIKEYENKTGSGSELKIEVSKFLENTPLKKDESVNINFMVDELVNRIKNKMKHNTGQHTKRVVFHAPKNYQEFSKDVSFCSSFCEMQKCKSQDEIKDKSSVNLQEPPSYSAFEDERPTSSSFKEMTNEQWYTLQSTQSDNSSKTNNKSMLIPLPYIQEDSTNNKTRQNRGDNSLSNVSPDQFTLYNQTDQEFTKTDENNIQVAGPSGYNLKDLKNFNYPTSTRSHISSFSNFKSTMRNRPDTIKEKRKSQNDLTSKCSIECQTINKNMYKGQDIYNEDNKINNATNTGIEVAQKTRPFSSQDTESQTSSVILKQHAKERERGYLNEKSDSDEEEPCRCIERYIKRLKKLQRPSENLNGLPPCIPFILPYPYFI